MLDRDSRRVGASPRSGRLEAGQDLAIGGQLLLVRRLKSCKGDLFAHSTPASNRGPANRRKSCSVRIWMLPFPESFIFCAFLSLALVPEAPTSALSCRPTTRKSVFEDTSVFTTAPTSAAICAASALGMWSSPVNTMDFPHNGWDGSTVPGAASSLGRILF